MTTEVYVDILDSELDHTIRILKLTGLTEIKKKRQADGKWTITASSKKKASAPSSASGNAGTPPGGGKWRVAGSLLKLLSQINEMAPSRNKQSDGTVGDLSHQNRKSDHNPHVKDGNQGIVTAMDITHDSQNDCDCQKIVNSLVASEDSRIKYVIWKKRIISSKVQPWRWRKYDGSNPHTKHMHISVVEKKSKYDSADNWNLFELGKAQVDQTQVIAWGNSVSKSFKKKVIKISGGLGVDPSDLMAVMAFESARTFSSSVQNPTTKATGLIQFMPKTAKGLGTTTNKLKAMTPVRQLDYVEAYLKPFTGRVHDIFDLYMAVLWPAAIGKPNSHILFSKSHKPKAYKANSGLDQNDDGAVTKAEAASRVINHLHEGLRDTSVG